MSEDADRATEDISKQLNELKQWKQNIGLKAVISAEEYKKELDVIKTQSDEFKNELIETQKESRDYQEKLEQIKLEKDDINEELKQLKEDINIERTEQIEKDKLSQEAIIMKDQENETLNLNVETLQITKQSLESQLASIDQQSKGQQMELNECNQEIQRLKMEKNDIMIQLNEYKQNEEDRKLDKEMMSKQLNSQQVEYQNMKQENNKINKELIELQLTLKNIKQENQSLIKDNDQYKEILTKLREKEDNLKQKVTENELKLQQFEMKYNELSNEYEQEHDQRISAEMDAAQFQDQIEDMEKVSISSNVRVPQRQQTRILLPQKTMLRLNVSKESRLTVPTISKSFRNSTRKILTSMMSSVLDVHNSPQTLFASINDTDDNEEYIDNVHSFNDADSVCTDASFQTANDFDLKRDGIIDINTPTLITGNTDDIVIELSPRKEEIINNMKARRSSNSLQNIDDDDDYDILPIANMSNDSLQNIDKMDDKIERLETPKAINMNRESIELSSPSTKKKAQSPFGNKFDPKVFEKKLQEEIKKEMEALEKQLQREYNVEFEKKKDELIAAHQESLAFVTDLNDKINKELEGLRKEYQEMKMNEMENLEFPGWAVILRHIFAI